MRQYGAKRKTGRPMSTNFAERRRFQGGNELARFGRRRQIMTGILLASAYVCACPHDSAKLSCTIPPSKWLGCLLTMHQFPPKHARPHHNVPPTGTLQAAPHPRETNLSITRLRKYQCQQRETSFGQALLRGRFLMVFSKITHGRVKR